MGAGDAWKAKREALGKSLQDVSNELHISQRFLKNIEEGTYEGWPERVFSSGFIRSYGKLLSENPEPVLTEYYSHLEAKSSAVAAAPAPTAPAWIERERQKGSRRTNYTISAAVVLLVGVLLAWLSWRITPRTVPHRPQIPAPAAVSPPGDNTAAPGDAGRPDGEPASTEDAAGPPSRTGTAPVPAGAARAGAAPAPTGPARAGTAPVPAGSAQAGAASMPAGSARLGTAPSAPRPEGVASAGGLGPVKVSYQLFVEASDLTWMMYSLDGAEPVDVMLYPGDRMNIQAQRRITLKLGNAGGVAGTLNGKPLPAFGPKGQVKEITFGQ